MTTRRGDMKITGNSHSNGGSFDNVKIMGDAVINSDTHCELFKCLGNSEVKGSLHAGNTSCNGTMKVAETMSSGSVKIQGELRVGNELTAESISVTGELAVGGRMSVEKARITGELHVNADCEMEELKVQGSVEVNGMLNAEQVDLKLYGHSRMRELVGGQITVKKHYSLPLIGKFIPGTEGALTAETIEGDTIVLENTRAAVVRGRRVMIGGGCRIGLVEYRDEFEQDQGSSVSQSAKIGS
ncbi:hypothetical protein [Paenibacillus azoreducens]|uniref:Polymer-forming cytoskeletal protein n=1 Tax=Paenibacillus azoreducens TaxID=116718 RepID=A0A919YDV5_9BACL|nr:hypothetical protein [Paenibacillus azoreducens]GIO48934.1 hypothetical protein J34TS1_36990 [Paenibacillus azoreducens]